MLACLTDRTRRVLFVAMNTVTGVVERALGLSGGLANTVFANGIPGAIDLTFVIVRTIADLYQRGVCRVLVGGAEAGLAQIRAGMACCFRRYAKELPTTDRRRQHYANPEAQAQAERRGLWADNEPVEPWD